MKLKQGTYIRCEWCGAKEVRISDKLIKCTRCGSVHGNLDNTDFKIQYKSPCNKFCEKRHVGCHDECEDYKAFREWKDIECKDRLTKYNINSYIDIEVTKNKKRFRRN